ncbi:MAG: hypothetical protein M2R45_04453 [Verrucomicrobia subdivision 3 bacterium]|nr:hypothetical protein [Limisphaerales bacterium]MCS1415016.1 hypothetical protein [Limisphaerales bacterium]
MDVLAIFSHTGLFVIGLTWIIIYEEVLICCGKDGSDTVFPHPSEQVRGLRTGVEGAFHPSLAPIGVLLAVLGYGVGNYGAYACA